MKTKSLFFAALILVSAVTLAAGKDEPRKGMAVVPVKGSEIFKVIYKGETTGKVKLSILDSNSKVILTQTMNGVDGFICPLNFAGLTPGEYTIEVVDASGKKSEKIVYGTQKSVSHVHVSKIKSEVGKYLLSVNNVSNANLYTVKIYDSRDNLIYTESKEATGNFAQVYKFQNSFASYTFEVSDNAGNTKTIRF